MKKLLVRDIHNFQKCIREHYHAHGRDLPWRKTRSPYRILISEVMLQQTQVERVIPKYREFLKKFPDFTALNCAPLSDVLTTWQGMGYNRRALMLKKLAGRVMVEYKGRLPSDPALLIRLPGIGKGTAGSIAAFAFQIPTPFIETNIRRVFLHFFFPKAKDIPDSALLELIGKTLDAKNPREWYYGLMDYGAMLGREEKENPNRRSRHYTKQSRFEGSDRQMRGQIVRLVLASRGLSLAAIAKKIGQPKNRVAPILNALDREGFLKNGKGRYVTNII